jgi:hypothetical protein
MRPQRGHVADIAVRDVGLFKPLKHLRASQGGKDPVDDFGQRLAMRRPLGVGDETRVAGEPGVAENDGAELQPFPLILNTEHDFAVRCPERPIGID